MRRGRIFQLADHVREHYTVAATSTFGGDRVYVVYVNRDLSPTGNHEPLRLPCLVDYSCNTSQSATTFVLALRSRALSASSTAAYALRLRL